MKEIISKLRFLIDKIKYKKGRHLYISIIVLLVIIVVSFIIIYINMRIEVKRNENILKSYYSEINIAGNKSDGIMEAGADGNNKETSEVKTSYENKDGYLTDDNMENMEDNGNISDPNQKTDKIKVYICGSVKNPGVYEIDEGARVIDILEVAGGQSENACPEIINLAQPVVDGQRIYVPSREEITGGSSLFFTENLSNDYYSSDNRIININAANLEELETLPGVGPVIAQNIIEYRNRNGSFKKKEELKSVTGIGDKKYEEISKFISV